MSATDLRPALRILYDHDALGRLDAEKGSAMPEQIVYLAWLHDMVLDVYADAASAEACLADYRAAYPGDWRQLPSGRWYLRGGAISRLVVEARPVLGALPIIHADVAPRDNHEAL